LTFNATFIPLDDLHAAGFVEYAPPIPLASLKRRVFVAADVAELLHKDGADSVMFNWFEANRILSEFVLGRPISVSFKSKRVELERLENVDEIWACCIRKPRPGSRLFGRFVAQDCLVLMAAHDRHALGQRGQYQAMAQTVIAEWNRILPNVSPYSASKLSGYISGVVRNADED
jgi:hypothetical protein